MSFFEHFFQALQDVFFTYNTEDQPFDLRYVPAKLNGVIYGDLISSNEWINNSSL